STLSNGITSVIDPEPSWVARWQRVGGVCAVGAKGRVPEDVEAEPESRSVKYQPSNQTDQD
ncbi:hypothetical protein BKA82DRAFT_3954246, partial [Pisolithus tinctorius]